MLFKWGIFLFITYLMYEVWAKGINIDFDKFNTLLLYVIILVLLNLKGGDK